MERAPHEDIESRLSTVRSVLAAAPDGGVALRGFEAALSDESAGTEDTAQNVEALAATQLLGSVKQTETRAELLEELRSLLRELAPSVSPAETLSTGHRALVLIRKELRNSASGGSSGTDNLFVIGDFAIWLRSKAETAAGADRSTEMSAISHRPLTREDYALLVANDEEMWGRVIADYRAQMSNVVLRTGIPEHAVDEVVDKALDQARRKCGDLHGVHGHSAYAWLKKIARRTALSIRASTKQMIRLGIDRDTIEPGWQDDATGVTTDPPAPEEPAPAPDWTGLRAAIDEVINDHLAPGLAASDLFIGDDHGCELRDELISPELRARQRIGTDARMVLAAAVNLFRELSHQDLGLHDGTGGVNEAAPNADKDAPLKDETGAVTLARRSFELSRQLSSAGGGHPTAAKHLARRNAPSVLFAAVEALRLWLAANAPSAHWHEAGSTTWELIQALEREMSVLQLSAISTQFADSLSTLKALGARRCEAMEDWAADLLEDFAATMSSPDAESIVQSVRDRVGKAVSAALEDFEKPPDYRIDGHHDGLAGSGLSRAERTCLEAAVAHYDQLRAFHDTYLVKPRPGEERLEEIIATLGEPDAISLTRARGLQATAAALLAQHRGGNGSTVDGAPLAASSTTRAIQRIAASGLDALTASPADDGVGPPGSRAHRLSQVVTAHVADLRAYLDTTPGSNEELQP